jgi:hypothetical protein
VRLALGGGALGMTFLLFAALTGRSEALEPRAQRAGTRAEAPRVAPRTSVEAVALHEAAGAVAPCTRF